VPGFVKTHADAATASEAIRRVAALRLGGIPTPAARQSAEVRDVVFDQLDGETGLALAKRDLGTFFEPLVQLHACPVPGLRPYDPFLRIRPRLSPATAEPLRGVLEEPVPQGSATLHGDLHLGQFIQAPSGKIWIVDLDDLAVGAQEADLANFAAHLATSLPGGIGLWADRVRSAWLALQQTVREDHFQRFLRFSLVRRHLKLREAGRPDFEGEIVDYLRESSNFSMR
jgi:hypothetical protein